MSYNPLRVSLENIIPLTEARDHFSQIVNEVQKDKLYVLTKGGKPAVAIIDVKYLEHITGGEAKVSEVNEEIQKAPEKVGLPPMVKHDEPAPAGRSPLGGALPHTPFPPKPAGHSPLGGAPAATTPPSPMTTPPAKTDFSAPKPYPSAPPPPKTNPAPTPTPTSTPPVSPKPDFSAPKPYPSAPPPLKTTPAPSSTPPSPMTSPVPPKPAPTPPSPSGQTPSRDSVGTSPSPDRVQSSERRLGGADNSSFIETTAGQSTNQADKKPGSLYDNANRPASSFVDKKPAQTTNDSTIDVSVMPDGDDIEKDQKAAAAAIDRQDPADKPGPATYTGSGNDHDEPEDMVID